MTGFARVEGGADTCVWTWEAKSVNAKGLDVRLRLPRILDALEARAREGVAKRFKRGNISLNLEIEWNKPLSVLSVNEDVLAQILKAVSKIQAALPQARAPGVDGILALKGVLEQTESALGDEEAVALEKDILSALDAVLEQLADGREAEGQRLGAVLHDQLADIEALCEQADALAALQPDAIRKRLVQQLHALGEDVPAVDADRLAQEVVLVVIKADVREELDRLVAHIAAARDLLCQDEAVGRRLDFLCQEFNREANTLCSKSSDTELTRVALSLKAVIEQFREQVQNIE